MTRVRRKPLTAAFHNFVITRGRSRVVNRGTSIHGFRATPFVRVMHVATGVAKSHGEATFYHFHNTYYTTLLTYPRDIKIVKIPSPKKSTKKKEKLDFLSMRFCFLLDTPPRVGKV